MRGKEVSKYENTEITGIYRGGRAGHREE